MKKIYQGEPVLMKMTAKDDNGQYIADLSNLTLEAIIKSSYDNSVIKGFSSQGGTITFGTHTKSGVTIGHAIFGMTAAETKNMCGAYSVELAKVLSDGRAIGIKNEFFCVEQAKIKGGIN